MSKYFLSAMAAAAFVMGMGITDAKAQSSFVDRPFLKQRLDCTPGTMYTNIGGVKEPITNAQARYNSAFDKYMSLIKTHRDIPQLSDDQVGEIRRAKFALDYWAINLAHATSTFINVREDIMCLRVNKEITIPELESVDDAVRD